MPGSFSEKLHKRARLGLLLLVLTVTHAPASEERVTPEMIQSALEGQGYRVASVTRTLLGRARVVASQGLIWREVVLDLSTGQILRDYAVEFTPETAPPPDSVAMPRGGQVISDSERPGAGG
ncbi:MAG: hypothetical protein EA339_07975 [Rhodobacteraceae bacterium]|nr:MAG: hypothetical protein EA339_07975 [Paracoccaceae bacterium]